MTDGTADLSLPKRRPKSVLTFRHSAWVRATHWIWVICLTILLMSGLQIFNAYPALNFGQATTFNKGPLVIGMNDAQTKGITTLFGHDFDTTGVLGLSQGPDGPVAVAFPQWATIPASQDLATARRWHFLFAWILVVNGFVYLAYSFVSGHIGRDIWPRLREFKTIPQDIVNHLRLRFGHGEEARHYNVLQKITYAALLFGVLPLLVLAGLEMSPGMDSALPWLRVVLGGRQSARSIHFIMAALLVLFVIVHVVMVVLSGPFNNLRSMITGRFAIKEEAER
jgi:thiosulfate reductase cytochrome b subunit